MGLFNKRKFDEQILMKVSNSAEEQLNQLTSFDRCGLSEKMEKILDTEITLVKKGIKGEETIEYELKTSGIPMYALHGLRLEYNGLAAQIDFLVITHGYIFVIECKNLYGDIEINNRGEFIRTMKVNGTSQKEGIYSPFAQNERHLRLIKQVLLSDAKNNSAKKKIEKQFDSTYHSVVVLSNAKTVLNIKNADSTISQRVIRADSLIAYINKVNSLLKEDAFTDADMKYRSDEFFSMHKEPSMDYTAKYREDAKQTFPAPMQDEPAPQNETPVIVEICDTQDSLAPTHDELAQQANALDAAEISDTIVCPKCGSKMRKQTAKKGARTGEHFWGCTKFPKCYGTRPFLQVE